MGIGDIIKDRAASTVTPREKAKEENERQEELVKELVKDNLPPKSPKRPVGRPRKNSTGPAEQPPAPEPPPSAETVADMIAKRSVLRQLRILCRRFPLFAPPPNFNPHECTAAQLKLVVQSMKDAVRAEVEFLTTPAIFTDGLEGVETAAMFWAASNPEHPAAPIVSQFHNAATALKQDPAVDLDLGLIECEITDYMPDSPWLRLLINGGRVLLKVFTQNTTTTAVPTNKFDGF